MPPDGKTHNHIDHILIDKKGIQVYLISETSRQQIVILLVVEKFERD
jgi:hypothetical protein